MQGKNVEKSVRNTEVGSVAAMPLIDLCTNHHPSCSFSLVSFTNCIRSALYRKCLFHILSPAQSVPLFLPHFSPARVSSPPCICSAMYCKWLCYALWPAYSAPPSLPLFSPMLVPSTSCIRSAMYRKWLYRQPHRRHWDRWIMMGTIGVCTGMVAYLLSVVSV